MYHRLITSWWAQVVHFFGHIPPSKILCLARSSAPFKTSSGIKKNVYLEGCWHRDIPHWNREMIWNDGVFNGFHTFDIWEWVKISSFFGGEWTSIKQARMPRHQLQSSDIDLFQLSFILRSNPNWRNRAWLPSELPSKKQKELRWEASQP